MQLQKRTPLWLSLSLAFFALSAGQSALAQDTAIADDAKVGTEEEELDAVVVTGSRIRRAGFDTLEPAITIGEEYIKSRAITNVADAINEIPGFGAGVTPEGGQNAFGANVNFVNRFGLGTNRTLTLVNGRRFVSSNPLTQFSNAAPGNQVDLNAIPTQLVDRIENLAIGGAPTYGSDAIAGTVNVILKTDYEGAEVSSTYGATDAGGNERFNLNAVWGSNFSEDRGNVTLSASVDNSAGVLQSERELFTRTLLNTTNPLASILTNQPGRTPANDGRVFGTPFNINTNPSIINGQPNILCSVPGAPTNCYDGIPDSVLIQNRRIFGLTNGGLLLPATGANTLTGNLLRGFGPSQTTYIQFSPTGDLVSYDPGIPFSTVDASGGQGLNLSETGQIISDLERQTVNTFGHFELTDSVRVFWEGTYFYSESLELVDQPVFNATLFAGASGALTFSAADPRLTPQARGRLSELGVTSFRLSRASRDLVINNSQNESYIARGVIGLDGSFDALNRSFFWETSLNYGKNESDSFQNVLNQQHFINAINVTTNAAGQIVCDPRGTIGVFAGGVTPIADAACVPLDIFGEGRATDAAKNYVTGRAVTGASQEQTVFNANIGFAPFELWAGPIDVNFGVEYREEKGEFNPNDFQIRGLGRSVAFSPLKGDYHTNEVFGEMLIPLISPELDVVGLKKFDLTFKGRQVDNTVNGTFNAWTAGFQYRPIDELEIRGNKTRSLRAPSLVELFLPTSSSFAAFPDPCDTRNINGGTRPAVRRANCEALFRQLGINGNTFQSTAVSATVPQVSSGDPNLQNEQSDAKTIGFVWQPAYIENFRLAMDYYEIDISNAIANLGAAAIGTGCYDNLDFNAADPRNGNSFCSRINRDAMGQLVETTLANGTRIPALRSGFVNGAFLDFQGISLDMSYDWQITDADSVQFTMNGFNVDKLENSNNAIVVDVQDGELGLSQRQYQFGVGWVHNNWGLQARANYVGAAVFDVNNQDSTRDQLSLASYVNYNLSGYYQVNDQFAVRAAVTNLTDKDPPFGTTGIGNYDILGRRYAITGEYRF